MENIDICNVKLWGNSSFDYICGPSVGNSGGILSVWDPCMFEKDNSTISDYFVAIRAGEVVIMGDFNEVHTQDERFGSIFNIQGAAIFNSFISSSGLVDVPMGGCSFTWVHKSAAKMSRLDRFLISEEGFDKFMEQVWNDYQSDDSNVMLRFMNKLKFLKTKLRSWTNTKKESLTYQNTKLKSTLIDIDKTIDAGYANSDLLNNRKNVMTSLLDMEKIKSLEVAQKAKIKWSIEGDENLKFFHGILNKKRNNLAIRGILVDGVWIDSPSMVKDEFLSHFKNRFDCPSSTRLFLNMNFPNQISLEDQMDSLWVLIVEIGSFGRTEVIKHDSYFFQHGSFPKGGNSSFIALIPKSQNANMVKDFRPISLIGSLYKIIAKIMVNRLVSVLEDIVSDVQSAFVAGMFKGVSIGSNLHLSHLFYADDVVFLGQWSNSNISTIIKVLKCFFCASGLSINMHKSKLMRIAVDDDIFPPQVHKMRNLSYRFFNGVDIMEKKLSFISWNKVLASKNKGGLGVSSFFAMNHALMFKWVWRFKTDSTSLWAKIILAMHGKDGNLSTTAKPSFPSIWLDIIRELHNLKNKGIDLLGFIKKKIGNGVDTLFWEDTWKGDIAFKFLYPRIYKLETCKHINVASKLVHDNVRLSLRPPQNIKERWIGPLSGQEILSVVYVRKIIDDYLLLEVSSKFSWRKMVPIKVNILAWKVKLDVLPTRFNLSKRGLDINSILCLICENHAESSSHLFFACSMARDIFRNIASWWDVKSPHVFLFEEWEMWTSSLTLSSRRKQVLEGIIYIG
ncbi:RNA-directed DNA polymerase, eukaryota [Tanacetum coccineum]